jgi:porphobilinogen synthase
VIYHLRQESEQPIASYNVSGETAMVKVAAERGSYHACDAAAWLRQG